MPQERRTPVTPSSSSRYHRRRSSGSRDERYRSDVHTEAVQAALAKHKERKMAVPMPSKRRSLVVQTSMDTYTPPDTSSGSEGEGSIQGEGTPTSSQGSINMEHWISRAIHGSTTSSTTSSSSTQSGGSGAASRLADVMAQTHIGPIAHLSLKRKSVPGTVENGNSLRRSCEFRSDLAWPPLESEAENHSAPPDVTTYTSEHSIQVERPQGAQMLTMRGEQLGVVTNWPPSLEAALQRWGTISPKAPCLTTMDTNGKPLYILTYGKLWTRSMKVAYNILHKLGTKQEPMVRPGDRVALVFPNNDPAAFMVAFYGCLLAEVVPVPIEVPLTRKDAGSQQIGFLLGSCGVTVAMTSDACHKGLPKSPTGEIPQFKGWPKLLWFVTESKHLSKPPRDWFPHIKDANNDTAYIEYKTCKDGSVLGVTVMRIALLTHCQALTQSCCYTEAETIVNVLDFKKDVGLWHGILTSVMNMMHVISIPYSLMKVNPLSWIQKVCQYKAKVACVKSRDMHWALVAHRDQRDINLSSLRMLIVADGSNPWSISSCDAFLNVFQSKGLRPEVICPCASSPEALTVAIRRPTDDSNQPPGRGVLSMQGLSHGVIRVDSEEKLSVLTVQDVGTVMPGALMCVVKPDGVPQLCRTDEIGELCVFPMTSNGAPISEYPFTRTGLLGFVGPGGLVFIAGKMDGLMVVGGRRHNADDIVATALAVEPMKFVYRGRIAVFSISVLHDERIVVVAEQRPDSTEEDSFQWMSRVLQAIDGIHQVGVYCLALVPSNTLPKTPLGGIHLSETKQLFLEGSLHPCNVLMCPHTCWRAQTTPDHVLFTLLNSRGTIASSLTCLQLHKRAEKIAAMLAERGHLQDGDHVALVYPPEHRHNPAHCEDDSGGQSLGLCNDYTGDLPPQLYKPSNPDTLAYLDFSVSTTGMLAGMSHTATSAFCRSIKLQCELYPSREVAICLDPYCGLGFVLWCLCSVYSGHQSILIPPSELEVNPALWLLAVSQYKVRDTFCSYSVMELCTKGLGLQTESLKSRGLELSRVRTCVVVAEERPRISLTQSFSKLFKDLGLHPRAVSTAFGCRVNLAICLQGTSGPDPTTVYVDMRALRHDRVRLVERGSPHSLPLMESGKILPGVRIIIANPETKGPLGDSHLGESDHFNSRLSFGDTQTVWARTGYLGFLRRTELTDASGERHDALYVVGALDEAMELRGMRYHPIDIETSLDGSEQEALDLVPLVTNVVLEEHYLIVGVVVVVDIGVIPINSRGEKQRMHLRDGFLADQLDPIYVAYNM
ncbi:hypothetical protein JZ751_000032 [Albula glossodonta]|uniref:DMAP1-binding domain-containing protein n=1 Tax=Albula glossodonta TaxID=121402 RepID=A0A8T2PV56_9TELE|nr:hypothetical protein JZ751_000032 [Albula glossodonta]